LKSHEWIEFIDEKTARVGISDFAQQELGDIVFVNLPEVGDEVVAGEGFAEVESVKSISEVYSPVTGVVRSVNEKLQDSPELVNEDAYDAWFVEIGDISAKEELLNEEEYNEFLESEN
jgi:glycine cleavage system H protein